MRRNIDLINVRNVVAGRCFDMGGRHYEPGQPVDVSQLTDRKIGQLLSQRFLRPADHALDTELTGAVSGRDQLMILLMDHDGMDQDTATAVAGGMSEEDCNDLIAVYEGNV